MRLLKAFADSGYRKGNFPVLGINGRLNTIQAAILLEKIEIFDDEINKRQAVAQAYGSEIENSAVTLPEIDEGNTSVFAQYTILSPNRDMLSERLKMVQVPSVSYYAVPLHLQPVFKYLGYSEGDFPTTERIAKQCLSLPMNPYLTAREIEQVCAAINTCSTFR